MSDCTGSVGNRRSDLRNRKLRLFLASNLCATQCNADTPAHMPPKKKSNKLHLCLRSEYAYLDFPSEHKGICFKGLRCVACVACVACVKWEHPTSSPLLLHHSSSLSIVDVACLRAYMLACLRACVLACLRACVLACVCISCVLMSVLVSVFVSVLHKHT